METYSFLRAFADSWFLIAMFTFFLGACAFAFWPTLRGAREDAAGIPLRDDAPGCAKTALPVPVKQISLRVRTMAEPRIDELTGRETMGHDFDGIEELNNPMPRWWLISFYLLIIWGIGYTIAYPAWPMISGATKGLLGYSTRGEVAADIAAHEAANAELVTALLAQDMSEFDPQSDLHRYAAARGGAVFGRSAASATGPVLRVAKAIPTCWTTTGFGAVLSRTLPTRSATVFETRPTTTRAIRKCLPLKTSSRQSRSRQLRPLFPPCPKRIGKVRQVSCLQTTAPHATAIRAQVTASWGRPTSQMLSGSMVATKRPWLRQSPIPDLVSCPLGASA